MLAQVCAGYKGLTETEQDLPMWTIVDLTDEPKTESKMMLGLSLDD